MKRYLILLAVAAAVTAPGCGTWKKITPGSSATGTPDEIHALLALAAGRNEGLKTIKGIGKARVTNGGRTTPIRIAWIASCPDKIRFELLGLPGQPSASLSFDGTHYYFSSLQQETIEKGESDGSMLESIISIPIDEKDVIDILAGRVPVIDFDSAAIEHDGEGQDYILTLQQGWFGKSQKLYYDCMKTMVKKVEVFGFTGSLEYSIRFDKMTRVNNYLLPAVFSLSNEDGAFFRWETERSYTDIPVSTSVFVLMPYDKKEKNHSP